MPTTPLISAKSGQRSAYFGGPFTRIEDTADIFGPGVGLYTPYVGEDGSRQDSPYPGIRFGVNPEYSDPSNGYSFQWLKNTTEFGLYYPDMQQFGSGSGSLSSDFTNLTIHYSQVFPDTNHDYYKTLTVDDTVYALGPSPLPLVGPVARPAVGSIHTGSGFDYAFVDGLAELFDLNVSPYFENGKYMIFTDGTMKNAFEIPAEFAGDQMGDFGTMNDGTYNYTVQSVRGGVDNVPTYLTKWQSSVYDPTGSFDSEAFSITLNDPTDDAIWQDYFAGENAKQFNIVSNTNEWIFVAYAASTGAPDIINPRFSATVFIFSMDMTTYERVDVTFSDMLNWGSYFKDVDGLEYAIGSDPDDGTIIYQVGASDPIVGSGVVRAWTATIDGHDFYFLRLGADSTLVFDVYSEEWVEWSDADVSTWRASSGINWAGGAALSNTYGTTVVAGDDTLGLLWFLDPSQPYDQSPDPDSEIQQIYFPRIIQGQVIMTGRQVEPCFAVWLTTDMGSPAYVGAGVKLEISDDAGASYDDMGTVGVTPGEMSPELSWYSLGQIEAPGRLFKITDDGAVARIDSFEMNDPADK